LLSRVALIEYAKRSYYATLKLCQLEAFRQKISSVTLSSEDALCLFANTPGRYALSSDEGDDDPWGVEFLAQGHRKNYFWQVFFLILENMPARFIRELLTKATDVVYVGKLYERAHETQVEKECDPKGEMVCEPKDATESESPAQFSLYDLTIARLFENLYSEHNLEIANGFKSRLDLFLKLTDFSADESEECRLAVFRVFASNPNPGNLFIQYCQDERLAPILANNIKYILRSLAEVVLLFGSHKKQLQKIIQCLINKNTISR